MADRQSMLDPMSPAAASIAELWWVMLVAAVAVTLVTLGLLAYAVFRRRGADDEWRVNPQPAGETAGEDALEPPEPSPERGLRAPTPQADRRATRWIVFGGIAAPLVILVALFVLTLVNLRAIAAPPEPDLVIEVTGLRWWWQVAYLDEEPGRRFLTANEIHIPAGRPVELRLRSFDVIHSFWIPQLQGKLDLIPGQTNVTWLQADEPGVYRGQCAEYCGLQHTRMGLLVIAQEPDEFERWRAAQLAPAVAPANPTVARGRDVFETAACALCHTIRGTPARGTPGPDLTHVASRRTLAALTVRNDRAGLRGWVGNPQGLKPGSLMPPVPLPAEDFNALVAYLETLR